MKIRDRAALKRHNLKIIETLFESTACLIANAAALKNGTPAAIETLVARLKAAVEG
jgi:ATP phosphoribosyltransferase